MAIGSVFSRLMLMRPRLSRGLAVTSCTIVMIGPNAVAGEIHNRMPVILPPESYDIWLFAVTSPAGAKALLRPYEDAMIAYPVSKDVGAPKNDRPDLIEEVHLTA
ncbi:MAG: SOS response-associated peptidase family protein [Kiloniellaceae bacterium]